MKKFGLLFLLVVIGSSVKPLREPCSLILAFTLVYLPFKWIFSKIKNSQTAPNEKKRLVKATTNNHVVPQKDSATEMFTLEAICYPFTDVYCHYIRETAAQIRGHLVFQDDQIEFRNYHDFKAIYTFKYSSAQIMLNGIQLGDERVRYFVISDSQELARVVALIEIKKNLGSQIHIRNSSSESHPENVMPNTKTTTLPIDAKTQNNYDLDGQKIRSTNTFSVIAVRHLLTESYGNYAQRPVDKIRGHLVFEKNTILFQDFDNHRVLHTFKYSKNIQMLKNGIHLENGKPYYFFIEDSNELERIATFIKVKLATISLSETEVSKETDAKITTKVFEEKRQALDFSNTAQRDNSITHQKSTNTIRAILYSSVKTVDKQIFPISSGMTGTLEFSTEKIVFQSFPDSSKRMTFDYPVNCRSFIFSNGISLWNGSLCYFVIQDSSEWQSAVGYLMNHSDLNAIEKQNVYGKRNRESIGKSLYRTPYQGRKTYSYSSPSNTTYKSETTLQKGIRFERECIHLLNSRGYVTQDTKKTGDFGVDIVARKNGRKIAVQCKNWKTKVGAKAVQEIVAGRNHYQCDKAIVISQSGFTKAAYELAKSNGVELRTPNDI